MVYLGPWISGEYLVAHNDKQKGKRLCTKEAETDFISGSAHHDPFTLGTARSPTPSEGHWA